MVPFWGGREGRTHRDSGGGRNPARQEPPLNYHQDSIRFGWKVLLPQKGERFAVAAGADAHDFALSSISISAPLLASRMRISGSGSKTGGTKPRWDIASVR